MLDSTISNLDAEMRRSVRKYPSNAGLLSALKVEQIELANALVNLLVPPYNATAALHACREAVYAEALQVAVIALRIAEEGDPEFPGYVFTAEIAEDFYIDDQDL